MAVFVSIFTQGTVSWNTDFLNGRSICVYTFSRFGNNPLSRTILYRTWRFNATLHLIYAVPCYKLYIYRWFLCIDSRFRPSDFCRSLRQRGCNCYMVTRPFTWLNLNPILHLAPRAALNERKANDRLCDRLAYKLMGHLMHRNGCSSCF